MTATVLFPRRCRVVVGTTEIVAIDKDPAESLTVRFQVEKSLTKPNKAEVHIYNMLPDRMAEIAKTDAVPVQIDAGYERGSSTIFLGTLRSAQRSIEGADRILSLSSGDGELAYKASRVTTSVKKGTPSDVAIRELVRAIGILEGNVNDAITKIKASPLHAVFTSGTVIQGNAARELSRLSRSAGLTWSVQDGKLQFLSLREALKGEAILLTSETGLIDEPSVDNKKVLKARMLMAPDVFPGRLVVVKAKYLTGQWRIERTVHSGDTSGNDWFIDVEGKAY